MILPLIFTFFIIPLSGSQILRLVEALYFLLLLAPTLFTVLYNIYLTMSYLLYTLEYPSTSLSVWLPDEGIRIKANK